MRRDRTYPLHVSTLELVLLTDVMDYVMEHFEAEDADTAQMFRLACLGLRQKLNVLRADAGLPDVPGPDPMIDDEITGDPDEITRNLERALLARDVPGRIH
ncbi:MAG: hypothetical protein ACO3FT_08760 [Ilumatobacteraceae bacterium]